MAVLVPSMFQAFDNSGNFLVNGRLYFFLAGTDTPAAVYTNAGGGTAHSHPITLDARGEASVWIDPAISYKRVLKTSLDATLYTEDNVQAANAATMSYTPSGTGAVSSTVQNELDRHIVSSLRFMSEVQRGDVLGGVGSVDVTVALQKWIDYCETNGCTGEWVAGKYLQTATLTVNTDKVYLRGDGKNTELFRTGDFGHSLVFTGTDGTATLITQCGVTGVFFNAQGRMTSGALLRVNGVSQFSADDLQFSNGFRCLHMSAVVQAQMGKIYGTGGDLFGGSLADVDAFGKRDMALFDSNTAYSHPSCGTVFFNGFQLDQNTANPAIYDTCIRVRSADGIWFDTGHVVGGQTANVLFDATQGTEEIGFVWFGEFFSDSSHGPGIRFSGTNRTKAKFDSGCTFGGAQVGTIGLLVDAGCDLNEIILSGVDISGYTQEGVKLLDGERATLTGCTIRGNSTSGSNLFSGIYAENVDSLRITGGQSSGRIIPTGPMNQKYGIDIGAGCGEVIVGGGIDLTGNVSGSINDQNGIVRGGDALLEKTPFELEAKNLVPHGGVRLAGGAYLDGNALTGITDTKKGTLALAVKFDNAMAATEVMLDSTGARFRVSRTSTGGFQVIARDSGGVIILQQTLGSVLTTADYFTMLASWDLAVPGSMQIYVNDATGTITNTTFTDLTIDYTVAENSLGADVGGANTCPGNYHFLWFDETVKVDFSVVENRRKFFDAGGTIMWTGARGELPTGSQPRVFHAFDDADSWIANQRGSNTGTWTSNGAPTTVTTEAYGYDRDLLHGVTTTTAAHKVGRMVKTLTANRGGTTTLDLTFLAAQSTPGRQLTVRTIQAQTVVSGASDVVPLAGGAAGTGILAATAGKYAVLELNQDNSTWTIINAN